MAATARILLTLDNLATSSSSGLRTRPPGHTVRVTDDSEVILFSPRDEHTRVLDHMLDKMAQS